MVHAVPGQPQVDAPPSKPVASAEASQGAGQGQSINAEEPWRFEMPKPGPARPLELATPTSATLPNGLTLILNERRGLPIVAASLVIKAGSDANPVEKSGLANFVAAMLDEGTKRAAPCRLPTSWRALAPLSTPGARWTPRPVAPECTSKNFGATLDLMADVALRPSFPADEIQRQRANRLGRLIFQQHDDPGQVAAQVMAVALYGSRHPYGYTEIGTEAATKAVTRAEMIDHFLAAEFRAERRGARRSG